MRCRTTSRRPTSVGVPSRAKFLAGVGAQYESEMVLHNIREDSKKGHHLTAWTAVREHSDMSSASSAPSCPRRNKFAALNSAVW